MAHAVVYVAALVVVLIVLVIIGFALWGEKKPAPSGGGCPPCALCPPSGECPACPLCPRGEDCPPCVLCPPGQKCPACALCPRGKECPACPLCPRGEDCPPCGLCPPKEECPPCPLPLIHRGKPQVYYYDVGHYGIKSGEAEAVAKQMGAKVASYAQLKTALEAGANWCRFGWITMGRGTRGPIYQGAFPLQKKTKGCGRAGINFAMLGLSFGVTLYGPKPAEGTFPVCGKTKGSCIMPWSKKQWYAPGRA